jgi:N6-adenosine-specific RNA methylase IME4
MLKKFWLFGPLMGLGFASLAAAIFTVWDWLENPGGIFRDSSGTNWNFVYDTAVSWFVPTFIDVAIIASVGHIVFCGLLAKVRKRYSNKYEEFNSDQPDQ